MFFGLWGTMERTIFITQVPQTEWQKILGSKSQGFALTASTADLSSGLSSWWLGLTYPLVNFGKPFLIAKSTRKPPMLMISIGF